MALRFEFGEAKLYIGGQWVSGGPPLEVRNKYSGDVIGTVPTAREDDVDAAIAAAQKAAPSWPSFRLTGGPRS